MNSEIQMMFQYKMTASGNGIKTSVYD